MTEYFIIKDGVQVGPYTLEQLGKMLDGKMISGNTVVRLSGGMEDGEHCTLDKLLGNRTTVIGEQHNTATLLSDEGNVMRIGCPVCGQHYKITEDLFEIKSFRCVKCSCQFKLPARTGKDSSGANHAASEFFDTEIPEGDLLCPHCWKSFDRDYVLYISVHPSLFGDPILGEYVQKRFVPTVFNQAGQPLDQCGLPATEMACPRCHLRIPSGMVDTPALYFSIAGATSSGKSYFLTCMIHQLRKCLSDYFGAAFFDADPRLNETLNLYEKQLFMALDPKNITSLPATQISGEGISDRVKLDDIEVELPKPFVFEFRNKDSQDDLNMVFYDNSGEMFIPGRDEWVNQATFHLSHSDGIMFLFDPTNDASMRLALCDERDPQVSKNPRAVDQTILLTEMISRIRRHANMVSSDTCKIPLVIAVGKYDTWKEKFPVELSTLPYITNGDTCDDDTVPKRSLYMENILAVSYKLREMMLEYVPGLVNAAESFFEEVYFVPVSNFGTLAEQDADGRIGVIPEKISPVWVEVPILILLSKNEQIPEKEISSLHQATALGRLVNNHVAFIHPENGKQVFLPSNYAGIELAIGGKLYRLPGGKREKEQQKKM